MGEGGGQLRKSYLLPCLTLAGRRRAESKIREPARRTQPTKPGERWEVQEGAEESSTLYPTLKHRK